MLELAFHHDLRGDARVVGARLPQRVVALHAVVARERIHQGLVEAVAHVQRAGDVGRRQLDAEILFFGDVESGLEITGVFPGGIPAGFDVFRVKTFCEFHCGLFGECVVQRGRDYTGLGLTGRVLLEWLKRFLRGFADQLGKCVAHFLHGLFPVGLGA